jgi:hypothetical protein
MMGVEGVRPRHKDEGTLRVEATPCLRVSRCPCAVAEEGLG